MNKLERIFHQSKSVILVVVACGIALVALNRDALDPAILEAWLVDFGTLTPLIFVILYAVGTILFAPGSLLTLAGGVLFGPIWGTILNLSGATIGAGISFLIARFIAGDWVAQKTGPRFKRLSEGVDAEGWRFVAFVRLVPLFPFNLTNYALGLTRIQFLPYMVTSFTTMAPGALAFTWLGYSGREATGGNSSAIQYGFLALGMLAAVAVLPHLVKQIRRPGVHWVEAEMLLSKLRLGEKFLVLDFRSVDSFIGETGHLPDAMNVPLEELEARLAEIREKAQEQIITVCHTYRRSVGAQIQLRDAGIHNILVLRGGMQRWNELGYETQRSVCRST